MKWAPGANDSAVKDKGKINKYQTTIKYNENAYFLVGIWHIQRWLLTHKQLEKHECAFNSVATDALVLKHQAIRTHSADSILIV